MQHHWILNATTIMLKIMFGFHCAPFKLQRHCSFVPNHGTTAYLHAVSPASTVGRAAPDTCYSFGVNQDKHDYGFGPHCVVPITSSTTVMHHIFATAANMVSISALIAGVPQSIAEFHTVVK